MTISTPAALEHGISPSKEFLSALFGRNFEIPFNQRGWAWGNDLLARLWRDVLEMSDQLYDKTTWLLRGTSVDPHFFGTIIIERVGNKSVIQDGQQRITSVLLFLVAMHDELVDLKIAAGTDVQLSTEISIMVRAIQDRLFTSVGTVPIPKIKADTTISAFFENYFIYPVDRAGRSTWLSNNAGVVAGSKHASQLVKDFAYIQQYCIGSELKKYNSVPEKYNFLTSCYCGLMYGFDCMSLEITSPTRVTSIFKSLNEGGKILNAADLIKNQLVHVAHPAAYPSIRTIWESLGKERQDFVEFFKIWYLSGNDHIQEKILFKSIEEKYLHYPANSQSNIPALQEWSNDSSRLCWIENKYTVPLASDGIILTPALATRISVQHKELHELGISLIHIVTLAAYKTYFKNSSQHSPSVRADFYTKSLQYAISTAYRCVTIGKIKTDKFAKALSIVARNIRTTAVPSAANNRYFKTVWSPILQLPEADDAQFKSKLLHNPKYNSRS